MPTHVETTIQRRRKKPPATVAGGQGRPRLRADDLLYPAHMLGERRPVAVPVFLVPVRVWTGGARSLVSLGDVP